jgi:hypothetical protein
VLASLINFTITPIQDQQTPAISTKSIDLEYEAIVTKFLVDTVLSY